MATRGVPGALDFGLRGLLWSLGLFGLVRLPWFEAHAVLPSTRLQAGWAERVFGAPSVPVDVTVACSGAEALALCVAAILAFPAPSRQRLGAAAGAIALVLGLNTLRIGTLGRAAGSPAWFDALHVYVWPALLVVAIGGYCVLWMRRADAPRAVAVTAGPAGRRFVWLSALLLVLFVLAAPLYLESAEVLAAATLMTRAAAWTLGLIGVSAIAVGNVLQTPRGAFLVTQECVSTPLIPLYLAAVFAYASPGWRRAAGLLAALPLFAGVGLARLLVVALPASLVISPIHLVHAFHQLLLAALVVLLAAFRGFGTGPRAWRRALLGWAVGSAFVLVMGPIYTRPFVSGLAAGTRLADPQGALALLPGFQVGLYLALAAAGCAAFAWRPLAAGLAALALSQVALFAVLRFAAEHAGLAPHVRDVRAWALGAPVLAALALLTQRRPAVASAATKGDAAYRHFWADVGERFPDLGGAASTRYYSDNERRLFREHFPDLTGLRLFKTDLWDEAKNTRILAWASEGGAHAYGVDISEPTVLQARAAFTADPLRGAVSDVRALPFQDESFDAIYSMGTIEHFDETEQAVREMARVLKPGGRVIVGVPNRHDPFLRPLLATVLQATGLYAYGYEKSFSRRALREMIERSGLTVVAETAIFFIPGGLRMLDLACHAWCRPLARVTAALVWPFVLLDRYVPAVRRHGYLLATVATRPVTRR